MASSLPMYAVLKSKHNNRYLEYVNDGGEYHGYVKFSSDDATSPRCKFEVERAGGDSDLVHLRCCYNSKYLVSLHQEHNYIVPHADKPEEDQSKWTCTLFRPSVHGDDKYVFKHVSTGSDISPVIISGRTAQDNLVYAEAADDGSQVFRVVDWKSLVVLPRSVAFKGHNGSYLSADYLDGGPHHYLHFGAPDSGHPAAAMEIYPNPDGSVRILSLHRRLYWRRSPNWIWADSDAETTTADDTNFWPVKLDSKTIALRNMGNYRFCSGLTTEGKTECLNAAHYTISKEARLEVTELVLSREIYNIEFHPDRARRYNEHPTVMGTGAASNTSNEKTSMNVKMVRTESESNSWSANVSLTLGVKTTLVTKVPLIAEGKIEISAELTAGYEWGKVHTTENTVETVYTTSVPPMTKVTVSAVGSTASCDIPYSYTQTDTHMDGTRRTYQMDDGMYTGVKSFNVTYALKHESLRAN